MVSMSTRSSLMAAARVAHRVISEKFACREQRSIDDRDLGSGIIDAIDEVWCAQLRVGGNRRILGSQHEAAVGQYPRRAAFEAGNDRRAPGGKFRRASTDVADRITKKLVEDYERAKKLRSSSPETVPGPR